ncbi:hypothetical protein ACFW9I_35085 [[Kitasatospora] papulosa]|uniref:hypothetical protein n=1 Tax=[Kitasatospora] papulosa TaxID=1464011 RepID=UPI0036749682
MLRALNYGRFDYVILVEIDRNRIPHRSILMPPKFTRQEVHARLIEYHDQYPMQMAEFSEAKFGNPDTLRNILKGRTYRSAWDLLDNERKLFFEAVGRHMSGVYLPTLGTVHHQVNNWKIENKVSDILAAQKRNRDLAHETINRRQRERREAESGKASSASGVMNSPVAAVAGLVPSPSTGTSARGMHLMSAVGPQAAPIFAGQRMEEVDVMELFDWELYDEHAKKASSSSLLAPAQQHQPQVPQDGASVRQRGI